MPGLTASPERPDFPIRKERIITDTDLLLDAVTEQIDREVQGLQAEHTALDERLFSIQEEYDRVWVETPIDEDSPRLDQLSTQMLALFSSQKNLRSRIDILQAPSEALRRASDAGSPGRSVTTRGAAEGPARAEPSRSARDRGVPDCYLGETGNFRPGMDARYKSDLILAALELPAPNALMTFDPADAVSRIEDRGWTHFLDRKREKLA